VSLLIVTIIVFAFGMLAFIGTTLFVSETTYCDVDWRVPILSDVIALVDMIVYSILPFALLFAFNIIIAVTIAAAVARVSV